MSAQLQPGNCGKAHWERTGLSQNPSVLRKHFAKASVSSASLQITSARQPRSDFGSVTQEERH